MYTVQFYFNKRHTAGRDDQIEMARCGVKFLALDVVWIMTNGAKTISAAFTWSTTSYSYKTSEPTSFWKCRLLMLEYMEDVWLFTGSKLKVTAVSAAGCPLMLQEVDCNRWLDVSLSPLHVGYENE